MKELNTNESLQNSFVIPVWAQERFQFKNFKIKDLLMSSVQKCGNKENINK